MAQLERRLGDIEDPGSGSAHRSAANTSIEHLERRMDNVVGRLSHEPSHDDSNTNEVPSMNLELRHPLEYDDAAPMNSPSLDISMQTGPPLTEPPPRHSIECLNYELQVLWLQKYHSWFPILHHTSISSAFSDRQRQQCLVQKAIMAVTVWDVLGMPWERRQSNSHSLRQEVILGSMEYLNLRSIQSLLILSILFWGEGKWSEYGSVIAMCKR